MLKNLDTDKILGIGLILALLMKIIGDIAITLVNGAPTPSDLPTNIVACLAGYMGRSLAEKLRKDERNNDNYDTKKLDH